MKIRDVLLTLIKSGQDFSDHGMFVAVGGEQGPMHDENCAFCDAWRAALYLLSESGPHPQGLHEVGDEVTICGKTPGVVEAVRLQYDVRLGALGDGYRPVGTFAPEFVKAASAGPTEVYYSDRDGDRWKVVGDKTLALCDALTWKPLTGKSERIVAEVVVRDHWGPLERVEKGA